MPRLQHTYTHGVKLCITCGAPADGSRGTRCKPCQRQARRPYNGTAYRATQTQSACTCCGAPDDLTHDHIVPLRHGGHNSPLRTLCRPCNSSASRYPDNDCRLEH